MLRALRIAPLLLALAGSTVRADEPAYVPPDFLSVTPPLPAGLDQGNVWRLDLAEALAVAVRQNLDVVLERKAVKVANLGVDIARGAFEPRVTAGYAHRDSRTPPSSAQEGTAGEIFEFIDDDWRVALSQQFSSGTRVELDFDNGRAKSSLGTAVEPLNYRSTLSLSIIQPLLRGFSTDLAVPRVEVLRARLASERERQQLVVTITALVERAEAAYWSVLQALYRYDLSVRTQKAAEDQMALTQRQINAGTLPPSDLISAESTLAQRRLELVQADQALHLAWDQLRQVLNLPREDWSRPILPIDIPKFQAAAITPEEALGIAIENRPELAQMDLDLKAALLSIRKADNDKLPQIDLGLTGTVVGQDRTYNGALDQLGSVEARGWAVFLNLSWTPLNRANSAAAEIARTQHEQVVLRREQVVQNVWFEVRDAVRNQRGAERQVRAAAKFRELAEKSLEIEQRKFLNGTSQNLFVAQRQEALASARLAEIDALLGYNRAAATLFRATGRLLPERHIELTVAR